MRAAVATVAALALGAASCVARTPRNDDPAVRVDTLAAPKPGDDPAMAPRPADAPRIDRLSPDSARVPANSVVEVLVTGAGFEPGQPGRNVVALGQIRLAQVPANDAGTEIRFVIPDRVTTSGQAPPMRLMPGTYPVTVTTSAGSSNALPIRILP